MKYHERLFHLGPPMPHVSECVTRVTWHTATEEPDTGIQIQERRPYCYTRRVLLNSSVQNSKIQKLIYNLSCPSNQNSFALIFGLFLFGVAQPSFLDVL